MTPKQAERAQEVWEVSRRWEELEGQHRTEFPPALPPGRIGVEPLPMFSSLLREAEREELQGIGRFNRSERQEARKRARTRAEARAVSLMDAAVRDQAARETEAQAAWEALNSGQADAVCQAVQDALDQRGVAATVLADDEVVQVSVEVPDGSVLPSQVPAVTATGAPTLKKLTKTQFAEHTRHLVAARVLLVAKETLAVSPATERVTVTAQFRGGPTILKTTLDRAGLASAPWDRDAWSVLETVDPGFQVKLGGRVGELRPLT